MGLSYTIVNFGLLITGFLFFKFIIFFLLTHIRRKSVVWINAVIWLIILNLLKTDVMQEALLGAALGLTEHQTYEILVISLWSLMKCLSFSLNYIEKYEAEEWIHKGYNLADYLGYLFYFPNFFMGPIIIYDRYRNMLKEYCYKQCTDLSERLLKLSTQLIKAIVWYIFAEIFLHYFYIHAMCSHIEVRSSIHPS